MSKHTPGPWMMSASKRGGFEIVADDRGTYGGPFVVASRSDVDHRSDESVANCALIAAAPDLLAACRMAYLAAGASGGWHDAIMDSLRSAIIKAGG